MHTSTGTAASSAKTRYHPGGQTGCFADAQSAGANIAKTRCCLSHQNRKAAPARAHLAPKNPDKTGTFLWGLDGRAWRFEEDAGKWWLYDRDGRVAVVFQQEANRYVIIKPHIVPEQSAATLEDACRLAETIALWTLPLDPDGASRLRATNNFERVRRQTAWGRPNISGVVESQVMAVEPHGLPIPDDLSIPDFLRRSNV